MRAPFPAVHADALNVPDAYCRRCFYDKEPQTCGFWCVERIDDFLEYASSGSVACMLIEPISGVGGNIVPPPGYLQRLKAFCDAREILLIFDENQTSFGRTGALFAADTFGVQPNIMTVSKGMTGSGMQLAAILTEERLMGMERSLHGFTLGGHTLSAAAALVTIVVVQRPGFRENVRTVGAYLLDALNALRDKHTCLFDVRGIGLMIGVEVADEHGTKSQTLAKRLHTELMRQRLITRVSEHGRGNVIELRPPLILTLEEAKLIAHGFSDALDAIRRT